MISVILPAYNEEENIAFLINDISSFFKQKKWQYEIIVVNDGSKDKTAEILNNYKKRENIRIITHKKNLGYGAALRSGFLKARGDLVFFTDADRQFNIQDITPFVKKIKDYDFVVGFRKKRSDPFYRIFYAKVFAVIARIFFKVKVKDVDCAFKLFKKNVLSNLKLESNGALINLEIFALARKKNYKFTELPVNHFPRKKGKQTGGNFKVLFKAFLNIFRLWLKLRKR